MTYLPVLGLGLEHHGVLLFVLLAVVGGLGLLGILLGLDAVILRKGALVASTAGVGEEVRANRLNGALGGTRQLANGLEVLFGAPALREDRQRQLNRGDGSHCFCCERCGNGWGGEKRLSYKTAVGDIFSGHSKKFLVGLTFSTQQRRGWLVVVGAAEPG